MVHDGARLHTYVYAPSTTQGPTVCWSRPCSPSIQTDMRRFSFTLIHRPPQVSKLGPLDVVGAEGEVRVQPQAHDFPRPYVPAVSCGGRLVSISVAQDAPRMKTFIAPAYKCLLESTHGSASSTSLSRSTLQTSFNQSLALLRHRDAWRAALLLDDRTCWRALGNRAVEVGPLGFDLRGEGGEW